MKKSLREKKKLNKNNEWKKRLRKKKREISRKKNQVKNKLHYLPIERYFRLFEKGKYVNDNYTPVNKGKEGKNSLCIESRLCDFKVAHKDFDDLIPERLVSFDLASHYLSFGVNALVLKSVMKSISYDMSYNGNSVDSFGLVSFCKL
ncbi:hypothetical protein PVK06_010937 [Gossypium arboreum]|uniref:Uncharacterized protein n=1 Tax=Gossypium arboreum TaxID=29729 RepID=A0ABR0Q7W8_GOSAR|nr:hypothetical protein PVK06_010937 [Gossypium arboreum]